MSILKKILILQGGYNEEHKVSINTAKQIEKVLTKLKINYKTLTVNRNTFKNPPNKFSAELIEKAGCKGLQVGGASVSHVHANFIINNGTATATDIEKLGRKVIKRVKEMFGITLEWEIKILGE